MPSIEEVKAALDKFFAARLAQAEAKRTLDDVRRVYFDKRTTVARTVNYIVALSAYATACDKVIEAAETYDKLVSTFLTTLEN